MTTRNDYIIIALYFRFYIGCDECQDWFHGRCVGVTQQDADRLETYVCPRCEGTDDNVVEAVEIAPKTLEELKRILKTLTVSVQTCQYMY